MDTLWAPWRLGYVLREKPGEADTSEPRTGCIFCDKPRSRDDAGNCLVARGRTCFVMLNLYPYNNGHLMVAPYRHVARLEELDDAEAADLMQVARRIEPIVRGAMNPDGFNLGMNIGRVAGAGIDTHLHLHLVPRWGGDINFMPVIADTHVMPQSLAAVRELLCGPVQTALDEMGASHLEP